MHLSIATTYCITSGRQVMYENHMRPRHKIAVAVESKKVKYESRCV